MKEDVKKEIEKNGLWCECGARVYQAGAGPVETQPNYNKYFEFIQCPGCHKCFYL